MAKRAWRLNLDLNAISDEGLVALYNILNTEAGETTPRKMALLFWRTDVKVHLKTQRGIEVV